MIIHAIFTFIGFKTIFANENGIIFAMLISYMSLEIIALLHYFSTKGTLISILNTAYVFYWIYEKHYKIKCQKCISIASFYFISCLIEIRRHKSNLSPSYGINTHEYPCYSD